MPTLIIDGKEITVKPGSTIMEAARRLGVYIPHFCYHPKLAVAGNCRMCLVEVEKMPKPVVSCAMPAGDGMVVQTDSAMVRDARRGVMEFLLINHPLDCPVCDQGGDCDLQDLAMKYGPDRSRFHDEKRQVRNKDLGPLIETEMDRCIHCTRCIRFSMEIAGTEEMGAMSRGDHMEVGPYVEGALTSEMAGNMAEICPVGALNDKPFHFQARGWELAGAAGICTHCSVGCHIRRDALDGQVKRVQAERCDPINETWICDKGRYAYDGLAVDRLDGPLATTADGGEARAIAWPEALGRVGEIIKGVAPEEVAGLAGADHASAEELFAFQDLLRNAIGAPHIDHRLRQRDFSGDDEALTRADLMMNTPLADLERADCILLVGMDPRYQTPLLNLRLRQAALAGVPVTAINPRALDANLPGMTEIVTPPGEEVALLEKTTAALKSDAKAPRAPHSQLAKALKEAERPALLLGAYAINHPQAEGIRRAAVQLLEGCGGVGGDWNGYNRVPAGAAAAAAQDLGVVPHRGPGYRKAEQRGMNAAQILAAAAEGKIKVLLLLGVDPIEDGADAALARAALEKATVIQIGAFRSAATGLADVVLAGAAPSEKQATYANCEGRVQTSAPAAPPPGSAKEDWRILRALSDQFPRSLAYNDITALRAAMAAADHRYNLTGLVPGELPPACDHKPVTVGLKPSGAGGGSAGSGLKLILEPAFYYDDPVARRSATLAQLHDGARVRINPQDAQRLKVTAGQRVRLILDERKVEMIAELDPRASEGSLFACYGFEGGAAQTLGSIDGGFPLVSVAGL